MNRKLWVAICLYIIFTVVGHKEIKRVFDV